MPDRTKVKPYARAPERASRRDPWKCTVELQQGPQTFKARSKAEVLDLVADAMQRDGATRHADPAALSLSAAAALHVTWCRQRRAWTADTVERMRDDLVLFAPDPGFPLLAVDRAYMDDFIDRMARTPLVPNRRGPDGRLRTLSLSSQKTRWGAAVGFLRWCVEHGLLERNPADRIGKADKPWCTRAGSLVAGRGKPQLQTLAEVEKYLEAARELPELVERVAVQLPLLCGLRSGEVLHLLVGDVDFDLGSIHVRDKTEGEWRWDVKTAAARRQVTLPLPLRVDLHRLCDGRELDEYLLASARRHGGPYEAAWLRRRVQKVCRAAGTRIVCTHGLRGTYSTVLHVHAGHRAPDIARFLGHSDQGSTALRHYIGAPQQRPALRLVPSGGSGKGAETPGATRSTQ